MPYIRKTQDVYVIQQYTGKQYGWEDVDSWDTYSEARRSRSLYRQNQPEYPVRIKAKREAK